MQPPLISLSSLFFVTFIMCLAMALAWGSFGRPRHALSWAIGYGCSAAQVVGVAMTQMVPRLEPYWWPFNDLLVIVPAALLALGARQRIDQPDRRETLALAAAVTFAVILVGYTAKPFNPVRETLASLFAAAMMLVAMRAIAPRGRASDPAERAMLLVLGLFAAFELVLVVLIYDTVSRPADAGARALYETVYLGGLPALFVALGIASLLLLAADLAARLRRLAGRDPLTGVHNRRGFSEAAERMIANAMRQALPITVAVVDIDHFKTINDRYGHAAGDYALGHVARTLCHGIRSGDLVGRIGGEEFALLLVDSEAAQTGEVMERIREAIARGVPEDDAIMAMTASFGVAAVGHGEGSPHDILISALDRADRALYQSKLNGRNRVTIAGA